MRPLLELLNLLTDWADYTLSTTLVVPRFANSSSGLCRLDH